jgi:uroporphyrinogen-III synthase
VTALASRSILVTRPERQAAILAKLIEQAGGRVIRFPTIEIEPVASVSLDRIVDHLAACQVALFVSRNAVEQGLARVRRTSAWPAGIAVAAIGAGTRRALEAEGVRDVIAPEGPADSEALLADPRLASVAGQRIVIFRGIGGREELAAVLRSRGALVEYAECYRRVQPKADAQPLLDAWSRNGLHAVTASSAEGLANLDALLGQPGRRFFQTTPLFVPHARVAEAARALGVDQVVVAGPGDEDVLRALVAYFTHSG